MNEVLMVVHDYLPVSFNRDRIDTHPPPHSCYNTAKLQLVILYIKLYCKK